MNIIQIIIGIVIIIIAVPTIALEIHHAKTVDQKIKVILFTLLSIALIGVSIFVIKLDADRYNNGKCSCGGHWVLTAVRDDREYYQCDKCGKTDYFRIIRTDGYVH